MFTSIVDGVFDSPAVVCLAIAYGIVYGVLGVMDLTLAARFAAAGYAGWWASVIVGTSLNPTVSPFAWLAAIVGASAVSALSWIVLRPLSRGAPLVMLIGSFGILNLLQAAFQKEFGAAPRVFAGYPVESGVSILGTTATPLQLISAGYAIAAFLAVAAVLHLTRFGTQLRVIAEDPEVAKCVFGLNQQRLTWSAVLLASVVIAPAGLLYSVGHGVAPSSGAQQALLAFVATIVTGRHRPLGSAFVALMLVITAHITVRWSLADAVAFLCISAISASAFYLFWRKRTPTAGIAVAAIAITVIFVCGDLIALWLGRVFFGAAGALRFPSAYQPLVPYLVVAVTLLWRPRGIVAGPPDRTI